MEAGAYGQNTFWEWEQGSIWHLVTFYCTS